MPNKIRGLPETEEFDFEHWRIEFQFALMLKIRYELEKRYIRVQNEFRELTKDYLDEQQTNKAIEKIMNSAYLTIPEGFWKEAQRYHRVSLT